MTYNISQALQQQQYTSRKVQKSKEIVRLLAFWEFFISPRCPCNFNFFVLLLQFSIYYDFASSTGSSLIKRNIEKNATLPSLLKFAFYPPTPLTKQGAWGGISPSVISGIQGIVLILCKLWIYILHDATNDDEQPSGWPWQPQRFHATSRSPMSMLFLQSRTVALAEEKTMYPAFQMASLHGNILCKLQIFARLFNSFCITHTKQTSSIQHE